MELRPYQKESIRAVLNEWNQTDKTLLVLPTGTGKTVVFSKIAQERTRDGRVLILAHRGELLEQARDKLYKFTGLTASIEKAESHADDSDVVVGSVQTLINDERVSNLGENVRTIIVDEAHHVLSDSYQKVLNHFPSAKVLGVTATPDRGDMKNLGKYFDSLAYEYTLPEAIKDGYLCPIRALTIPLDIDLTSVKVSAGDFTLGSAGRAIEPYLEQIADEMTKSCGTRKTVVFLPLIETSQKFCEMLNERGFKACEVNDCRNLHNEGSGLLSIRAFSSAASDKHARREHSRSGNGIVYLGNERRVAFDDASLTSLGN
jgi:superfamily II DNA or RNA helicase